MFSKVSIALELACVTACAYLLAAAVNVTLLPPVNVGAAVAPAAPPPPAAAPPPRAAFDAIVQRNLFNVFVPEPPKPVQKTVEEMPVAALGSQLIGTVYSDDPAIRRAIVVVGGAQQMLKAGEAVEGSAIKEILRRAVVLDRGGSEQIMIIEGGDAKAALKATRQSTVSRKWFKDQLMNLSKLVKGIRLQNAEYGERKGVLVQKLSEDSIFKGLGLKIGDLLLSVNGKPFTDYRSPIEALNLLNKSDEVKIDLLRINKVITLTYNMVE